MFDPNQVIPVENYNPYMRHHPIDMDTLDDALQSELYSKLIGLGNVVLREELHKLGFQVPSDQNIETWADEEMTEFAMQLTDNNPLLVRVLLQLTGIQFETRPWADPKADPSTIPEIGGLPPSEPRMAILGSSDGSFPLSAFYLKTM